MARPNLGRSIDQEDNLAERIRYEREKRGLSYESLAKAMTDHGCKIQGSAIFKIEKGEPRRRITVDELVSLSRVFEIPIDELLVPVELVRQERAKELIRRMDEAVEGLRRELSAFQNAHYEYHLLEEVDPELRSFIGFRYFGEGVPEDERAVLDLRDPDAGQSPLHRAWVSLILEAMDEAERAAKEKWQRVKE